MLEKLRKTLLKVVNKVFYATNEYDNEDNAEPPFIVFQETSKRVSLFAEDKLYDMSYMDRVAKRNKIKYLMKEYPDR